MQDREQGLTTYTIIIGLFCLSFAYNIHLYTKLQALQNSTHFWRCGTSQYEFQKLQEEIKRLENNPFIKTEKLK